MKKHYQMQADSLFSLVSGLMNFSILESAVKLEQAYRDYFWDPEPGVYYINGVEPIIKKHTKETYYTPQSYQENLPITDYGAVKTDVINEYGKIIIPAYVMQNQHKFLTMSPKLPINSLKLIKCALNQYIIDSTMPYDYNPDAVLITELLNEEGILLYEEGAMEVYYERYINAISDFVGDDLWHIYFVKLNNTSIIVEKTVDYRIWSWHKHMEDGLWS